MKQLFYSVFAVGIILFAACTNSNSKTESDKHDMSTMNKDSMPKAAAPADKEVKAVAVTYTNVDAKVAASIKEIVDHYLHIKNALANDNGSEAASGAKAMEDVVSKLDKSFFTAVQKKVYDELEADLKEHAQHIGKNGDKIKHQRSHFASLSEDVYDLVKAFGGGRALYHDHCPMYNENKGAMWISELKEVKNPYYGSEMLTCGTVEEIIQ